MSKIDLPERHHQAPVTKDDIVLLQLLRSMIHLDPVTGDCTIRNGQSIIKLMADGTIRIQGKRIIQEAEENFEIVAATIDLN